MNGINGIILDGRVYELFVNTDPKVCGGCELGNNGRCYAPHWIDCNNVLFRFSPTLTDKLNK